MKKISLLLCSISMAISGITAQTFNVTIGNTTGTTSKLFASDDILRLADGSVILAGLHDMKRALVKADNLGMPIWASEIDRGSDFQFNGTSVAQALNGDFIYVGNYNDGTNRSMIVKVNAAGTFQWAKTLSITGLSLKTIKKISNHTFTILAATNSLTSMLFNIDANGTLNWAKTFTGGNGTAMDLTSDGGYIITGQTSISGDQAVFLTKINSSLLSDWSQRYNIISSMDVAYAVQQTSDGGYIIGGTTTLSLDMTQVGLVIKTNNAGTITWSKSLQNNTIPWAYIQSIQQTSDGGFVTPVNGAVVKLDATGLVSWSKNYKDAYVDRVRPFTSAGVQMYLNAGTANWGDAGVSTTNYTTFLAQTDQNGLNCAASNASISRRNVTLNVSAPAVTISTPTLTLSTLAMANQIPDLSWLSKCIATVLHLHPTVFAQAPRP